MFFILKAQALSLHVRRAVENTTASPRYTSEQRREEREKTKKTRPQASPSPRECPSVGAEVQCILSTHGFIQVTSAEAQHGCYGGELCVPAAALQQSGGGRGR
uniref:Uncharacterized protein n=1 Tax=Knipowitschia caucasica TaxID=637954 RepID=A0AAV2L8I3_KNICA